ncbi:hypothetical protein GLOIN_2v191801 [Rhizophagus irregularis DAOM 181602=DAOM 197198]|uniref:Uncharacterized protein n=1 Tax=Rhizophagus irregularis (strain DAOM 181602 / DAOM 197198 / MUCL 43194) TaxID=747089 RepID=A0A2P4QTM7_RHIID|nr:hypothetical protein GLOIN_2v191801 [Rhizophagus irregularis DAOM 181602=DAOM 197198]POG81010.1 hypothetical protein GLOIN_2v191801 [Rhizophagus irregularis DAOM 181602=DAOM 197198]|eukprot:XP_025187876.1 hypothetical protein GLOIN_2v191801 [Rhizophagus irregularis DAOM 181602=DAOM 197198]
MKNIICSHFRLEKTRYLIYIIYVLFLHVWTFLIFKGTRFINFRESFLAFYYYI